MNIFKLDVFAEAIRKDPVLSTVAFLSGLMILVSAYLLLEIPGAATGNLPYGWILLIISFGIAGITCIKVLDRKNRPLQPVKQTASLAPKIQLSESQVELLKGELKTVATHVATELSAPLDKIRANIFVEYSAKILKMYPGCWFNEYGLNEQGIEINKGYGVTGRCFERKEIQYGDSKKLWREYDLSDTERKNINPNLKWVVSVPIPNREKPGEIFGVFCVDSLDIEKSENELKKLETTLKESAKDLGRVFNQK